MREDLQPHIEALRNWLDSRETALTHKPSLSREERKQLLAVEKTIRQLGNAGVSIPNDLRDLKLRLSAKDADGVSDAVIEVGLGDLDALIENLVELTREARRIRNSVRRPAEGQAGPKRHYGVSVRELVEAGFIRTTDELELQWLKSGPACRGKLLNDGRVQVLSGPQSGTYKTLSAAADAVAGRSLNGWDHWRRINPDGTRTPLTEIRTEFLEHKNCRP